MVRVVVAVCIALGPAVASHVRAAAQSRFTPSPTTSPTMSAAHGRALLDTYCVSCHNPRLKSGNLTLERLSVDDVAENADTWEAVVRKLRMGVMPPLGRPRPDPDTYDRFATWLEAELDRAAAAHADPGRTEAIHRLNRAEYRNAVRDLLALDIDVSELLPADDGSYGFDNIAGVLGVSPALLERYLSAARKISRVAVGASAFPATSDTFRIASDQAQNDRDDGLPFGTRGGTLIRYNFPRDGEYTIRVQLARNPSDDLTTYIDRHQLEISVDGTPLKVFSMGGPSATAVRRGFSGPQDRTDADWDVRFVMKAGPRDVAVTFIKKTSALDETPRLPFERPYFGLQGDTRYQPYLASVVIAGPFNAAGTGDTPSRERIFVCRPRVQADEDACAKQILSTLVRRAYRRPVTADDLRPLLGFYDQARREGGFEFGIETALRGLLASSGFLVRLERDPPNVAPDTAYRLPDIELASRLSFFLWSSIPDDELLSVAAAGRLKDRAELTRQVRRMLADVRSLEFIRNFAGQWLYLRNVPAINADVLQFPDFDDGLRQAFRRETELFFESIVRENRGVADLLSADYTFLNERLARHYGVPHVTGSHFRRVTLGPGSARGGLLGQGSILAATSYPNRTSPVIRGKWVLEQLLGTPPPPPPQNVPALNERSQVNGQVLSMRDRMVQHRANPACASCHAMMDPPGLALENFNAVGQWRTRSEANTPIDASGVLPDGTRFDGPLGLRAALLRRPERFVETVTEKLAVYALGRGLESHDRPVIRQIVRQAAPDNYRMQSLILGIVASTPFQMRRSSPAAASTSSTVARRQHVAASGSVQ
jgi:mono/diheme cytochrome c family protein